MTPQERKAEFDRLFESIPGRNIEKIRKVCSILQYKENTVRILRMKNGEKVIPERMLAILSRAIVDDADSDISAKTCEARAEK